MYQQLFDIISLGVFDGSMTAFQTEVVEVIATCGALSLVALPFVITFSLITSMARW